MASTPFATRFDQDTSVSQAGDDLFTGVIVPGWSTGRGPNGGYIAACILRGLTERVADPLRRVRSLTVHYLAPPSTAPFRIVTTVEKTGRSATFISGQMIQEDRLVAKAMAAFITPQPGPDFQDVEPPKVAAPEECPPLGTAVEHLVEMRSQFKARFATGYPPFSESPTAETGGWIRLTENRPTDSLALVAYTDGWLPAVYSKLPGKYATPTVDLSVHFRATDDPLPVADDAYCLVRFRTRMASGGFIEEDGEVFTADGRLVAQSRQLAILAPLG